MASACWAEQASRYSLTWEERERVVRASVQAVDGRVPLIVGCFVPLEEELVVFANRVQELGASAMMLTPPPFYKATVFHFPKAVGTDS